MKKTPKDPVNYEVQENDLSGDFTGFLNTVTDVPASPSLHPIDINEAGITNQQTYIKIRDIDGNNTEKPMLCNIEISVNLEGHRGIHMSRCEEVLFDLNQKTHNSLDDFAIAMAREIRKKQESKGCIVKVNGIYLHDRSTRVTQRTSQDKIYLLSEAESNDNGESVQTGVRAFNINACPCTRAYTKYSSIPELQEAGFNHEQIKKILNIVITGSHTQRGTISVIIDKTDPEITAGEIYKVIDDSAHLVYELLKRPDEHELVARALNNPQFTEDVAREVVLRTFNRFQEVSLDDTKIDVESILQDSIHIHDVRTKINTTFGKIRESIKNETR